jgi:hypothetical protein
LSGGDLQGHCGEKLFILLDASITSCDRVSICSLLNTIFHPEINKNEWENFFTLLSRDSGLL